MPAIVTCAACQTKLKVPENSAAKALRCPKCKGIVPLVANAPAPPPKEDEEFEVNEAVDEKDEEFEVNEAADEEEESDDADEEPDEDSALAELGFVNVRDVFKKGQIPDKARKAVEQMFVKKEKALWAGRPSQKIIESKAWIGLVVGPVCVLVALVVCVVSAVIPYPETFMRVIGMSLAGLFGLVFTAVGLLAVIFRKGIGGNVSACYVVTNKRAYIDDGRPGAKVRAFAPQQLQKIKVEESSKFQGAGDLIFAYDLMGDASVQVDKETTEKVRGHGGSVHSTAVGFLNIEDVQLVRKMLHEVLIDPADEKATAKKKAKKQTEKERKRFRPFG